jgi:hypothetical protein
MKTVTAANPFRNLQTTSALCKAANVTRGQLRLYEEEGLIAPQGRTEAGYRQYGADTLDPDGQCKFPRLWPPQTPPGKDGAIMTARC